MISQHSIDTLKAQLDIVDVISRYVEVKRSGSGFACVCPFHEDRNPSMSISQTKGFFHCFGCGASGDAFRFVMDYERVGYAEAVEKVAAMFNFHLTYTQERKSLDEKKVLENLGLFYRERLTRQKDALSYLASRNITRELRDGFELGWAGESGETIAFLRKNDFTEQDALKVGALKRTGRDIYASFINRITFAIRDASGRLVGFGGRTISDHPAKYVNSPESALFSKSRLLYAYDKAKKAIFERGEVVICEGYMDCIALHSAGVTNAVAVLGTALTAQHLPLLKREGLKVVLCFDADGAGRTASFRSAQLLFSAGIDGRVSGVSSGKDPADMVLAGKGDELRVALRSGVELGEFVVREMVARAAPQTPLEIERTLRAVQGFFAQVRVQNPAVLAHSYDRLVARLLGLDGGGAGFGTGVVGGGFGANGANSNLTNSSGGFASSGGFGGGAAGSSLRASDSERGNPQNANNPNSNFGTSGADNPNSNLANSRGNFGTANAGANHNFSANGADNPNSNLAGANEVGAGANSSLSGANFSNINGANSNLASAGANFDANAGVNFGENLAGASFDANGANSANGDRATQPPANQPPAAPAAFPAAFPASLLAASFAGLTAAAPRPTAKTRRQSRPAPRDYGDKAEAFVLKNLLERPDFLDFVRGDGDGEVFKRRDIYRAICGSQSISNPLIQELELYVGGNGFEPCADLTAFRAQYLPLKVRFFERKIAEISTSRDIPAEQKLKIIHTLRREIERLGAELAELC